MNKLFPKNSHVNKPIEFCAAHFEAFNALEYAQQSQLLTSISLELFATACCLIIDMNYLQALLTCLDEEQSQFVLSAIHKKQLLQPSPLFITRVQKMLISLHTMFSEVIGDVGEFTVTSNVDMTEYDSDLAALEAFAVIGNNSDDIKRETNALFCEQTLLENIKKVAKKDEANYQAVLAAGALKRLYAPRHASLHQLDELALRFPNFKAVIALIKSSIQISLLGGEAFSFPILNLQGEPGCGKTCFVKALADTLTLEFFMLNVASMSGRFELVGGNKQYGDADMGAIGQIMCVEAKTFQPLILIDELCMARDNTSDSVIQPLYSLFDREQRKSFKEHYLALELDLSGTLIITTTNNFEQLKPALKSRLVNFEIKPPTKKQMHGIVVTLYNESLTELALTSYFKPELPTTVLSLMAKTSPRVAKEEIRLAIGQACSRAKQNAKIALDVNDFDTAKFKNSTKTLSRLKKVGELH